MDTVLGYLPTVLPIVIGLAVVAFLALKFVVNVGPTQIAIIERRYMGKKLPANRAFAMPGEVGIQAKYLDPGLHFVFWPFTVVIKKENFVIIGANELGVLTATDGEAMPSGRVFAEDAAGEKHGNFQDPIGFLENGGIRGKQLRFLTNGTYKIHPFLFQVARIQKTMIPEGCIGVVTAADGASLEEGQLLGKRIAGHDNFQKAEVFLKQGGQKGPQIDFLKPGTYNIHTDMLKIEQKQAVQVRENEVGIVDSKAGQPMGKDDVVAETPDLLLHSSFQDGQAFLDNGGKRGPQVMPLRPGTYYINPYLFSVVMKPQTVIKQGEVGVLISHVGKDPAALNGENKVPGTGPVSTGAEDPEESRHDSGVRGRHVVPEGFRGIQMNVLMPGNYNINPLAYTVIKVPTTTRSIEWSENQTSGDFNPFSVVSNDGFEMQVEVRCQYRILPENAPYVVQKLGSIEELEKNVLHPQIDGIFRAQVSKSPAIKYQQERANEQTDAETAVRTDLDRYKVEIVSVMICNIKLPQELMHTTQERNLAQQREQMYTAQEAAENKRISFAKKKAEADQQPAIIAAQSGIEIARHEASQMEERAKGTAKQIEIEATATAGRVKQIGDAEASVIESKGAATAKAYAEQGAALTPEGLTVIEIMRMVSEGKVKIVPDVVAGGGNSGGGMVDLLLADMVQRSREPKAPSLSAAPAPAKADEAK